MFTPMCDIFIMCFVLFMFVTCFGWNFNAIAAAAAAAEEDEDDGSGGSSGGGGRPRRRREGGAWGGGVFGVIMTNTEIFHIFHIISLFNLPFFIFSISFRYSTYFSSIFYISFHFSTYFSSIFSISFHISSIFSISFHNCLLYFPILFTIQLIFLS